MAKHYITRSCNHEEIVDIAGPVKDRDRRAAYEASKLCAACHQEELKKKRERDAAAAREKADLQGLPTLVGISEAQVNYAEAVRRSALDEIESTMAKVEKAVERKREEGVIDEKAQRMIDAFYQAYGEYRSLSSAREWLDVFAVGNPADMIFRNRVNVIVKGV